MRSTCALSSPPITAARSPTRARPCPAGLTANSSPAITVRPWTLAAAAFASASTGMSPDTTRPVGEVRNGSPSPSTRNHSSPSIFGETSSGPEGRLVLRSSNTIAR